jgi:hypothetical protein
MNVVSCFIEIPPRVFTPKRLKINPETTIKIEYFKGQQKDHLHHVSILRFIRYSTTNDSKILNKRGEVLKESGILAVTESQIYKHH